MAVAATHIALLAALPRELRAYTEVLLLDIVLIALQASLLRLSLRTLGWRDAVVVVFAANAVAFMLVSGSAFTAHVRTGIQTVNAIYFL